MTNKLLTLTSYSSYNQNKMRDGVIDFRLAVNSQDLQNVICQNNDCNIQSHVYVMSSGTVKSLLVAA
jgi:hypothetical protein